MKKSFMAFLAFMLVFILPAAAVPPGTAYASGSAPADIKVVLNGLPIPFDQPPIIVSGRTLVPLRAIFEALGADVGWDPETQTVSAQRADVAISLSIGSDILKKNDEIITLDVPAQLVGGRTLVPVRAISECFGAVVGWDDATQTVTIGMAGLKTKAVEFAFKGVSLQSIFAERPDKVLGDPVTVIGKYHIYPGLEITYEGGETTAVSVTDLARFTADGVSLDKNLTDLALALGWPYESEIRYDVEYYRLLFDITDYLPGIYMEFYFDNTYERASILSIRSIN